MIANPNWFKRRTYTGWGLKPKCWQGWAYVSAIVLVILATTFLVMTTGLQKKYQLMISACVYLIILIDFIDIALKIKLDEREILHEAIAERNVAWFITLILCGGVLYQAINSVLTKSFYLDPFIIVALSGAVFIKSASFWYLSER